MANIFYNRIIRKLTVGFGNMFNDITLVRYNPDNSEAERFLVPIAYAAKEHYVQRLQDDYNLDKKVQMTLPRLSYEMTGLKYDATRKQNTNTRNFAQTNAGVIGQYNPVPYNLDFKLYLYVRNIEDGTQVIEHILPYFTPDYTIKLNMIPEMGIIKEVPVILNDITQDITYEGDRGSDPRLIIWTLNFTVKANFYGPVSTAKIITHSITSIFNQIGPNDVVELQIDPSTGVGSYQLGETVYQGVNVNNAIASGTVVDWNAITHKLKLIQVDGNFISTEPLYGFVTSTNYKFTSYNLTPAKLVEIDIYASANTDADITADTNFTIDNDDQPITIITEIQ